MSTDSKTHFGYKSVPASEKADLVGKVFDSVAGRYDLMNDLMSAGTHRLWKRAAVELAGVHAGSQVLDVAAGTGDLAARFSSMVGEEGRVTLTDINAAMLSTGRDRLIDQGHVANTEFVLANAESLPFADNSYDCVTIGFGLRNVTNKDAALRSMLRVLKPGGRLLVLEFSKPHGDLLSRLYDTYSFGILPQLGKWVANDEESYRYLAESIRMHPDQETLLEMIEDAGFIRCDYHDLAGGIVAIHRGVKA